MKTHTDLEAGQHSDELKLPFDLGQWSSKETSTLLSDVAAHFLLSLSSEHTRRNYSKDLQGFFEFTKNLGIIINHISDITEKHILLWQRQLQNQHAKYQGAQKRMVQSSVARKLSALSSLLGFAVKRKLLASNPAAFVKRPKVKRTSKTNAFTLDEAKLILDHAHSQCDALRNNTKLVRQYRSYRLQFTVLHTLFTVGMRVDELCELRIGDLEQNHGIARLHMTAKGGETHAPIIHSQTAEVLQKYIAEFRSKATSEDFLFLRTQQTRTQKKLTQVAIYKMIQELCAQVGITKKVSPHSCRATLATLLHNRGVPIGEIQDLLGHKQITTTAIYLKKANELNEAAATKIQIFPLP